jgi:DNA polymerase-3 subunit alpha
MRVVQTKKNNSNMAFGKFEDETGSLEFVAFPKTYAEYENLIRPDSVVLMKAKIEFKDEEMQLMAEKFSLPNEATMNHPASDSHHEIFIPRKTEKSVLGDLGKLLKAHPGDESVVILIPNGSDNQRMMLPYGVAWSENLEKEIEEMLN